MWHNNTSIKLVFIIMVIMTDKLNLVLRWYSHWFVFEKFLE